MCHIVQTNERKRLLVGVDEHHEEGDGDGCEQHDDKENTPEQLAAASRTERVLLEAFGIVDAVMMMVVMVMMMCFFF